MHFEVNEQGYFLNFVPEEGHWFLFKPTRSGIEAIPVVTDEVPLLILSPVDIANDGEIVN